MTEYQPRRARPWRLHWSDAISYESIGGPVMSVRGIGDRWLAGEPIEGVSVHRHDAGEIVAGRHEGQFGRIELLMDVDPEARYLVKLDEAERLVPVNQSALQRR